MTGLVRYIPPETIVKFFTEGDLMWYEAGSIKFGTLAEYRAIERKAVMGARYDPDEGISKYNFSALGLSNKAVHIPGHVKIDESAKDISISIETITEMNQWLFCATKGPYDKAVHEEMLYGGALGYPGDVRLTHYAEIETSSFLDAVGKEIVNDASIKLLPNEITYAHAVEYTKTGDPGIDISNGLVEDYRQRYLRDYVRAVIQKPPIFQTEREVRFVIAADYLPVPGSGPKYFKSDAIRNSMSFGKI